MSDVLAIIAATNPAESIATTVRAFVGPIFLLIISIVAIQHFLRGHLMSFIMFAIVGILAALLFYYPDFIENIAKSFYSTSKASSWG